MSDNKTRSSCPINIALEIFGDKWSLLIVRDLMFGQKQGYGEFLCSPEAISTNILADRLKQLERNGLIDKWPNPNDKKKFVYLLTQKGAALVPIMVQVVLWGLKYDVTSNVPQELRERIAVDVECFIEQTLASISEQRSAFLNLLPNS